MMDRRKSGRSRLTLILLVLTSITVLTLDFRGASFLEDARHAAAAVIRPVREAAGFVATPFENAWGGITNYGDVRDENEKLQARIEELEGELVRNADAARQLAELSKIVDLTWVGDIPVATAQVVAQPPSSFSHVVEINKGSSEGIAVNMPVVTGAGLAGRVVDVTADSARVQLISDPEFLVGVRIVDTQELGTAQGRGRGQDLLVDTGIEPVDADDGGVDDRYDGALLTTSGIDSRYAFPGSIPIGTVESAREADGGLTLEFFVRPAADLDELSFVNVLLWDPAD